MSIQCASSGLYPSIYRLDTPHSSYVVGISPDGLAVHLYYGKLLSGRDMEFICGEGNSPWFPAQKGQTLLDRVPLEYSGSGMADLRPAALSVCWEDGDNIADLRFQSGRIVPGKPAPDGLPHVYAETEAEAQTLILTLTDKKGLTVDLHYTVLDNFDGIMRRAVIRNDGAQNVTILRAMSASEDLPDWRMDMIHLHGQWWRECTQERLPVGHCGQIIESFRGSSGHQHNPFLAIVSRDCTETIGEAYGFSLVYSGNFRMEADVDAFDCLRVNAGLSDRSFEWPLAPGETFETPEAAMVYSDRGLGAMSRAYHKLYAKRLCRGPWRDRPRPVVLNTYDSLGMRFDAEHLNRLMDTAAKEGIELFVIDDGWFGHREDEFSSLGDWVPWKEKLGGSLADVAARVKGLGMSLGIWVEPEMISPDSNLYRAHPDWVLCRPGRAATLTRSQLMLDLSRRDVQDCMIQQLTELLASADISYLKWDMNRIMSEVGSGANPKASAGAIAHRYMLGVYRILEAITQRFPKLLYESCAGGGGRYDAGMLYYSQQIWTSDNSDAVARLSIQGGASLVYPPCTMACHVSPAPNCQMKRSTTLAARWNIAVLGGGFGYELDLTKLPPAELETIRRQVTQYKTERSVLFGSSFYRLTPPEGTAAFQQISEDGRYLVVTCCRRLYNAKLNPLWLRLENLDPEAKYRDMDSGATSSGAVLMGQGVRVLLANADFACVRIRLERI